METTSAKRSHDEVENNQCLFCGNSTETTEAPPKIVITNSIDYQIQSKHFCNTECQSRYYADKSYKTGISPLFINRELRFLIKQITSREQAHIKWQYIASLDLLIDDIVLHIMLKMMDLHLSLYTTTDSMPRILKLRPDCKIAILINQSRVYFIDTALPTDLSVIQFESVKVVIECVVAVGTICDTSFIVCLKDDGLCVMYDLFWTEEPEENNQGHVVYIARVHIVADSGMTLDFGIDIVSMVCGKNTALFLGSNGLLYALRLQELPEGSFNITKSTLNCIPVSDVLSIFNNNTLYTREDSYCVITRNNSAFIINLDGDDITSFCSYEEDLDYGEDLYSEESYHSLSANFDVTSKSYFLEKQTGNLLDKQMRVIQKEVTSFYSDLFTTIIRKRDNRFFFCRDFFDSRWHEMKFENPCLEFIDKKKARLS